MAETVFTNLAEESAGRARGFWVPRFELTIDGVSLDNRVLRDVVEVTYQDNVEQIDGFEMVVGNWDSARNRFKYMGSEGDRHSREDAALRELETLFEPCQKKVALKMGYASELTELMTGTFVTMEPTFSSSGPHTMSVRALNVLHRLRRKKYDGNFHDQSDSAIAKSFDGKVDPEWRNTGQDARRIPMPVEIDTAAQSIEPRTVFVGQKNEYDIDFLWRRARVRGYVVEIRKSSDTGEDFLYFGPSNTNGPLAYELPWGSGLVDLKTTLTTANQVKKVTVRSWDRKRQRAISESVDWTDSELRKLNPNLAEIVMQCDPREERVVTRPVFTRDQAKAEARSILRGQALELVKAQASTIGLPNLRAGSRVLLSNIGGRVSGEYFVTQTTHTFNQSGYQTKFTARREDPEYWNPLMSDHEQSAGIVIGKVTKVKDPEGLGRIQVTYPWLEGAEERWVSVAAPMAGGDAGIFCMPDENDEVILAFDHGQLDHPYVIGFLWNALQMPPSSDHRQRMIRSKNGHTIRLIDSTPTNGNSGGVIIDDNHGNSIVMTNGRVSIHSVGLLDFTAAMITLNGRVVRLVGPPI